MKRKIVFDLQ